MGVGTTGAKKEQTQTTFRLSSTEVVALLAMLYSAPIIFAPIRMFSVSGDSTWIAGMVSGVFGALVVTLWVAITSFFPGKVLPEIVEALLGSWLGWTVNLVFGLYFLFEAAVGVRMIAEVMLRILPGTPVVVTAAMAVLVALVIARLGPEVMGRLAGIHLWVVSFAFAFMVVSLGKNVDPRYFLPVLADGIGPVLNASLTPTMLLGHILLVSFLFPHMLVTKEPHLDVRRRFWKGMSVGMLGMGLTWLFFMTLLVLEQAVFGAQEAPRLAIPALTLVRAIRIGAFFERVEVSLVGVWLPAIFLKITVFLYAASIMTKHLTRSQAYRWYVLPLATCLIPASAAFADNTLKLIHLVNGTWTVVQLILKVVIPLGLLGVIFLRTRFDHAK